MNPINVKTLAQAKEAAVYNLYLYLLNKYTPADGETLRSIAFRLKSALNKSPQDWSDREIYRLRVLKNAIRRNYELGSTRISDLTISETGSVSCFFTNHRNEVFVVFRGTGSGEWLDNGEGLSGIPQENMYITYGPNGMAESRKTVESDHATDAQTEALNWFNSIAVKNGWNNDTKIIISGHSKGGNKAQFITIHSDLVDDCFSFDGQGFSPEALTYFEKLFGGNFTARRRKIRSFSAENDYVNVLGERLVPSDQIYYFESVGGIHYMEAILDSRGQFRPRREQGKLSRYIESLSQELMSIQPFIRKYAVLGIMNIFHQYLGEGDAADGDAVSIEETIIGIGVAISTFFRSFR